jgi:hypothetical protein
LLFFPSAKADGIWHIELTLTAEAQMNTKELIFFQFGESRTKIAVGISQWQGAR